ncbi:MAG: hypothetical protein CO099_11625, partial [Bdellovibrio sp. CG_4_9_14_3_um_filter_39_7]
IAILLDTSGSMQGLINQVRDGLWQTINGLGEIKKDGEVADLRLALYEYGSGVVSQEANFIQMLAPLTTDHTVIAQKLFATEAKGGTEYSGMAIQMASTDLAFSVDAGDFKSIVIAGNETIYQGPVDPLKAAEDSLSKDILVNSIFAGSQTIQVGGGFSGGGFGCAFCPRPNPTPAPPTDPQTELNPIFAEWRDLAKSGGGESLNIDHNNSIPYIASPFDARIIAATEEISETYLPFGINGEAEYRRMRDLDRDVRGSGNGSYIGWGNYRSGNFGQSTYATWDLVSALREGTLDLAVIPVSQLPITFRWLSPEERLEAVMVMEQKRKNLEDEVADLRAKRKIFVDEQLAQRTQDNEANFADAIKQILVKQLKSKGFTLSGN